MASVDGNLSLKPGVGLLSASAASSVTTTIELVGAGIFSPSAGMSINSSIQTLIGLGVISANMLLYFNGTATLVSNGCTLSATSTKTSDSDTFNFIGCAALFARPTVSSNASLYLVVGSVILNAVPSQTQISDGILIGKGIVDATTQDYIPPPLPSPCYYVHVNRIIEENFCSAKLLASDKCDYIDSPAIGNGCENNPNLIVSLPSLGSHPNTVYSDQAYLDYDIIISGLEVNSSINIVLDSNYEVVGPLGNDYVVPINPNDMNITINKSDLNNNTSGTVSKRLYIEKFIVDPLSESGELLFIKSYTCS